MDGYYDPYPLVELDRHLAIAGYLSEETRVVGYRLAALTGLTAVDLDRTIEHGEGKSVWNLIWSETEARYRQLESQHLRRVLDARPFSIVTLGDGALMDQDNRRLVLDRCRLVVLDLDLPNTYWRLKAGRHADMDFWHPLHAGPLERFEQVKPFHQAREPGFAQAHHTIPLRGKDKGQVVDLLKRWIEDGFKPDR